MIGGPLISNSLAVTAAAALVGPALAYSVHIANALGSAGTYQLPVIRSLNGNHRESGLLTIGVYNGP